METLTYFSMQMERSFAAWGYETFWMDFDQLGLSAWKLRQAVKEKEAVLITFNFIGLSGEEELWDFDEEGNPDRSIWEKLGILCLNIMVDHPIYYYKALRYPVSRLYTFCIDRDHTAYMKRFYPGIPCAFLPLAGNLGETTEYRKEKDAVSEQQNILTEAVGCGDRRGKNAASEQQNILIEAVHFGDRKGKNTASEQQNILTESVDSSDRKGKNTACEQQNILAESVDSGAGRNAAAEKDMWAEESERQQMIQVQENYEEWLSRPYELVFTANYVPAFGIEKQLGQLEPEYRDFYYEMIDAFIKNPSQNLLSGMEMYMRREMPDLTDSQLCEAMSTTPAVDLLVRTYFREQTVRALAEGGRPIHLFGKDWEKMPCKNPENLICSGHMVNSADCVQAVKSAKISLNTMPWFKDGVHDRVFTAMLHQTVSLTDDSAYLRSQFADLEAIVYYRLDRLNELPQLVNELLKKPELLYEIAVNGMMSAGNMHTWHHRAKELLKYIG